MGYSTDFIGHIEVVPPLSVPEQRYLHLFAASGLHVPDGPHGRDNRPGSWCQWVPNCDGRCITHNGAHQFYAPVEWLRYLIDHYLRPGAQAERARRSPFCAFTFDHVCNGIVAGCRRDTAKLFLIRVEDNVVTEETLVGGAPEGDVWSPFGNADELDRLRARRPGRSRGRWTARPSSVVPLRAVTIDDRD